MKSINGRHYKGLSSELVAERIRIDGYNELPSKRKRDIFLIAIEVVKEPMFLLLVGSGLIYMILGDWQEALMLLGFVVVIMSITIFQERKTESRRVIRCPLDRRRFSGCGHTTP